MRLALRALLVSVVVGLATHFGAAAQGSPPLVTIPSSVVFWNAQDGLLAVDQCRDPQVEACSRGAVELTTNGGRSYRFVLHIPRAVALVQTMGARGAIVSTTGGPSWRTLNRGRTWRQVATKWPRVNATPSAYWLNPRVGVRFHSYDAGSQAKLAMLVTRDGGTTWRQRPDPCQKRDVLFGAFADLVTPRRWWVACVGEGAAGNEDKAIYRTRNGGKTWQAGAATLAVGAHEPVRGGISSYGYPDGLAFAPSGWGLLTESRGTLYVTRNGGSRFHGEPKVARPEIDFAGGAAAFSSGIGYVLLAGELRGRLIETHDFGRTWAVVKHWGTSS